MAAGQAVLAAQVTMARSIKFPRVVVDAQLPNFLGRCPGKLGMAILLLLAGHAAGAAPMKLSDLPFLSASPLPSPYKWFASTDPKHKNQDYLLLKPGETRHIPLAAGNLERLWSTATEPARITLTLAPEDTTAITHIISFKPLISNGRAQHGSIYEKAFTLYPTSKDTFCSLAKGAGLVVTNGATQPNKFFYQAAVRPAPAARLAPPSIPGAPTLQSEEGKIVPGADLRHTLSGPGIVDGIEITPTSPTPQTWQDLRLQVWWDVAKGVAAKTAPAINAPLNALAGHFLGGGAVDNKLWTFDGKSLRLHAPMPYGASALAILKNGGAAEIHARLHMVARLLPASAVPLPYRFCAVSGATQTQLSQPVQMLHADGAGAFVGLSLAIQPTEESSRRSFAYLEGNETITADGQKYEGTGTEDFFNSAWYFPDKPYSHPDNGLIFKNKLPPQVAMYRLKFSDAVPFRKSLNFAFEHASGNSSNDLIYRWVAFWYQKPPLKFQVVDKLGIGAVASDAHGHATGGGSGQDAEQGHASTLLALLVGAGGVVLGVGFARWTRRKR